MPTSTASAGITGLPATLQVERRGAVGLLWIDRPDKRNALDDATIEGIGRYFGELSADTRAVVVAAAAGDHFSAGLDLGEPGERDSVAGMHHSRMWHAAFDKIQSSTVPVIAVLKGAVVGGGLELAAAAHLRVAEESTF